MVNDTIYSFSQTSLTSTQLTRVWQCWQQWQRQRQIIITVTNDIDVLVMRAFTVTLSHFFTKWNEHNLFTKSHHRYPSAHTHRNIHTCFQLVPPECAAEHFVLSNVPDFVFLSSSFWKRKISDHVTLHCENKVKLQAISNVILYEERTKKRNSLKILNRNEEELNVANSRQEEDEKEILQRRRQVKKTKRMKPNE